MIIGQAHIEDAREILELQKLSYQSEAAIYNDYTIPPLTQTCEEIESEFEQQIFLKACDGDTIIGSVRGYIQQDTCFVGRLIVHPDFQNRGVGTRLMHAIETQFSSAQRFELFTGNRSERNLYLYRKLGYHMYRQEQLSPEVKLVYMEKLRHE